MAMPVSIDNVNSARAGSGFSFSPTSATITASAPVDCTARATQHPEQVGVQARHRIDPGEHAAGQCVGHALDAEDRARGEITG
jgi:hypothetical protein